MPRSFTAIRIRYTTRVHYVEEMQFPIPRHATWCARDFVVAAAVSSTSLTHRSGWHAKRLVDRREIGVDPVTMGTRGMMRYLGNPDAVEVPVLLVPVHRDTHTGARKDRDRKKSSERE